MKVLPSGRTPIDEGALSPRLLAHQEELLAFLELLCMWEHFSGQLPPFGVSP